MSTFFVFVSLVPAALALTISTLVSVGIVQDARRRKRFDEMAVVPTDAVYAYALWRMNSKKMTSVEYEIIGETISGVRVGLTFSRPSRPRPYLEADWSHLN